MGVGGQGGRREAAWEVGGGAKASAEVSSSEQADWTERPGTKQARPSSIALHDSATSTIAAVTIRSLFHFFWAGLRPGSTFQPHSLFHASKFYQILCLRRTSHKRARNNNNTEQIANMASLFGGNTTGGTGGSSLFGSNTNQNTGGGGGGLFGSSTTQTGNTGGGLFGSSTNQSNTGGGGLFGSNTNQNSNTGGGGLFGSNTNQSNNTGGGGLFGSNTNQSNNTGGGGLFGSSTTQNKPAGGLFGSSTTQTGTGTGGGLFGSSTTQNTQGNTGGGLFGGQSNTGGGLGGLLNNQNASNTQNQTSNSAFGSTSLFGTQTQPAGQFGGGAANNQNQQAQQQQQSSSSLYNPNTVSVGQFGHTMTQAQLQKLQFSGLSTVPNEKRVPEQIATVAQKWNPENHNTVLKTWLYNNVAKEYAPFYYPNQAQGEDETSWEEALSKKPEPVKVDGKEINSTWVPTLCKGFKALGDRAETQAHILKEMRVRLHEMNASLDAIMNTHQQTITVKIATAKRQHQILSQRILRLAVKVQTVRNRGYALDAAEENLRKTLMDLEKQVMNPGFVGREDEIWARMVTLRERARWLEEEGKRVTEQMNEQSQQGAKAAASGVPENVLNKTKKILKDYEGQLQHLNKELEDVKKEFQEWQEAQLRRRA